VTTRFSTQVFGAGGLLSRAYPGFELRPGQIRMSEAVAAAIENGRHLIMEAPTGTGKTFAYLVPAIESGRKVVVSTGTKNLQEQLFFKDLPRLEQALGRPVRAAYMKGRDNYLCIKRFREFEENPLFEEMDEAGFHGTLADWSRTTGTGDRGELEELPESLRVWDRINARADVCLGQRCPDFEECYLTRMRRQAADAQIVVVNHHLLMADLLLKEHAFGQVIPEYSVLILDEAHSLEDVATMHLGRTISSRQVAELADDLSRAMGAGLEGREAERLRLDKVRETARGFFGLFRQQEGRFALETYRHDELWGAAGAALREALSLCLPMAREAAEGSSGPGEEAMPSLVARLSDQTATLDLVFAPERAPYPVVTWGEARGRSIALSASPIDVSGPLRGMLFSQVPTAVLTSATLAIEGSFSFVRSRLGIDEATDLILESPFDAASQAILYVPRGFPEPRHESFMPRFVEEVRAMLAITSGRAFILFTSFANLRRAREALAGTIPWPLLAQGDAPRRALLDRFRATPGAVLLATSSFWHGVDVQGDALSLVVIDKLPFDVPSDPIVAARIESLKRGGGNPFIEYQIPAAVIDLKQGLGRLIRSRQDRGVLAVMDARLTTRPYGRAFINSLPPYRLVHDLEAVGRFFAAAR
jgi:ATP-dependent DNA helicase DinG